MNVVVTRPGHDVRRYLYNAIREMDAASAAQAIELAESIGEPVNVLIDAAVREFVRGGVTTNFRARALFEAITGEPDAYQRTIQWIAWEEGGAINLEAMMMRNRDRLTRALIQIYREHSGATP